MAEVYTLTTGRRKGRLLVTSNRDPYLIEVAHTLKSFLPGDMSHAINM